jgi:hypothetical protein
MKLNKTTYFSLFFLLCFLASFSISTFQSFNTKQTKHYSIAHQLHVYSQKESNSSSNPDLLFEENENEIVDGFQIQAFIIPYFVAYFSNEVTQPKLFSAKPLTEKCTNPIYLAICNFRI